MADQPFQITAAVLDTVRNLSAEGFKAREIAPVEKAMASHSSTLAWKIPWEEEPGRLQSMRLLGVGHD